MSHGNPLLSRAFAGSNEDFEFETAEEFHSEIQGIPPNEVKMLWWVFQGVDLSHESKELWDQYDVQGALFWGCKLPPFLTESELRNRGAQVMSNPNQLPFKPFRGMMYRQEELMEKDEEIYAFYLSNHTVIAKMYQTAHDFSMWDALYDYLEDKTAVAIMGGHDLSRLDPQYELVVKLGRQLVQRGFLVATGGGPGAMEAGNLGAYLAWRTDEEVAEALRLIREGNDLPGGLPEYKNGEPARRVLRRFGLPTHQPSLGVPTFRYGHEPPNLFATWQAKFFCNAVREEGLIRAANGGVVYFRGSAGTRQEIFQQACLNHYSPPSCCSPMVFFEQAFWKDGGVFDLVSRTSAGKPYGDLLLCSDSIDEVVAHLVKFRDERGLPVLDEEKAARPHWLTKRGSSGGPPCRPGGLGGGGKKIRGELSNFVSFPPSSAPSSANVAGTAGSGGGEMHHRRSMESSQFFHPSPLEGMPESFLSALEDSAPSSSSSSSELSSSSPSSSSPSLSAESLVLEVSSLCPTEKAGPSATNSETVQ